MHKVILLLVLAWLPEIKLDNEIVEHFDLIEYNHYYSPETGALMGDQLIFYRWKFTVVDVKENGYPVYDEGYEVIDFIYFQPNVSREPLTQQDLAKHAKNPLTKDLPVVPRLKIGLHIPSYDYDRKIWRSQIKHNKIYYTFYSTIYRETFTLYDPEYEARSKLPLDYRIKLRR